MALLLLVLVVLPLLAVFVDPILVPNGASHRFGLGDFAYVMTRWLDWSNRFLDAFTGKCQCDHLVIVIGFIGHLTGYSVRTISGSLVQMHQELEQSARVCGYGPIKDRGVRITLPLVRSSIVWLPRWRGFTCLPRAHRRGSSGAIRERWEETDYSPDRPHFGPICRSAWWRNAEPYDVVTFDQLRYQTRCLRLFYEAPQKVRAFRVGKRCSYRLLDCGELAV